MERDNNHDGMFTARTQQFHSPRNKEILEKWIRILHIIPQTAYWREEVRTYVTIALVENQKNRLSAWAMFSNLLQATVPLVNERFEDHEIILSN